jgi:hypothetical protein
MRRGRVRWRKRRGAISEAADARGLFAQYRSDLVWRAFLAASIGWPRRSLDERHVILRYFNILAGVGGRGTARSFSHDQDPKKGAQEPGQQNSSRDEYVEGQSFESHQSTK